jgi:integrase
MRLREMFILTLDQVDIKKATIFLKRTKNGDERQVPMTTVAIKLLQDYVKSVSEGDESMLGWAFEGGKLFPWWPGDPTAATLDEAELKRTTMRVSRQFRYIFDAAECPDLHFHDTRHEATSRIFERTDLDYLEIAKITGHKDPRMLMIYANLRGSHLASKLWSLFIFASVAACAFELTSQTFSYVAWV